jgi:hypothetical protein
MLQVRCGQLFRRTKVALDGRNKRIVLIAVAAAAVVAATIGGWIVARPSDTDRAMAELRSLPLVGLVMTDVPDIEARLRAGIDEELRKPTQQGPSRTFLLVSEIRRNYIGPALAAADDASADAVMTARAELVRHLQQTDPPICREFSGEGIRRIDRLDSTGQRLFRNVLSAMEAAYRNGRAAGAKPRPVASDKEFVAMLGEAGFTPEDFHKLDNHHAISDAEVCALELRIDTAPARLGADKRGAFSRYMLTH